MAKPQESWSLFNITHQGKNYIVRMDAGLWDIAPDKIHSYKVGIATPLQNPNAQGFPVKPEDEELLKLEDKMINKTKKYDLIFTGSITGGGMKEFVFYGTSEDRSKLFLADLNKEITDRDLQLNVEEDRDWDTFKQLCPPAKES